VVLRTPSAGRRPGCPRIDSGLPRSRRTGVQYAAVHASVPTMAEARGGRIPGRFLTRLRRCTGQRDRPGGVRGPSSHIPSSRAPGEPCPFIVGGGDGGMPFRSRHEAPRVIAVASSSTRRW
jgi:hypothetical protein